MLENEPSSDQPSDDPVTLWIDELRAANPAAATKIWHHFVSRLYEFARTRLRPETRRVYDEEDAAQSAFNSVCAGIAAGRFPDLYDRQSIWRLMLTITARKVAQRHRHDRRQRRDVRKTSTATVFQNPSELAPDVAHAASREPTPEFAATFADTCGALMGCLDDAALQEVATLRIEGYKDEEIASQLRCSRRTVQRRLAVIRRCWEGSEIASG